MKSVFDVLAGLMMAMGLILLATDWTSAEDGVLKVTAAVLLFVAGGGGLPLAHHFVDTYRGE